jgi:two-component system response regulator
VIRNRVILLVEDNPNDVELTLRAFEKSNVSNEIVVAGDGEQAIHYLFKTGPHAGRDPKDMPEVVLLDMKLPKLDGLGVLRRIRADERTRRLPVVILTSSKEEKDVMSCTTLARTASSASLSTSVNSSTPQGIWGSIGSS